MFILNNSWDKIINGEYDEVYLKQLFEFISLEYKNNKCYPQKKDIFKSLKLTSFDEVKVIILGQDPYHNSKQADGLAFSVPEDIELPPSLKNIYKELYSDLKIIRKNGNLTDWAKQGVLLLNSILTVVENKPASHQNIIWEKFTDTIIKYLSDNKKYLVFILWGAFAQKKIKLINKTNNHLIIQSAHPSPLSSYRGFFGSKPFSKTNDFLIKNNINQIDW